MKFGKCNVIGWEWRLHDGSRFAELGKVTLQFLHGSTLPDSVTIIMFMMLLSLALMALVVIRHWFGTM